MEATVFGDGAGPIAIVVGILLVIAYFIPAIVAFTRNVPNRGSVLVINLLLGWTVIGWIVALAMAARSQLPRATN
ncbi:superinfection immunity protein [Streptomyces sp. NBC_01433]|uniref:superinfection immunity protein n=1 Tax=Streptomyces sp. NBC_01433 TaxID=2903864 RepID=UPI00225359B1|nr:superinfection immunity protein [Streptomyces sp. NBC_01433]MCX4677547.1 superinfection immunity protein [Streptomyces sp. NBC_01433]